MYSSELQFTMVQSKSHMNRVLTRGSGDSLPRMKLELLGADADESLSTVTVMALGCYFCTYDLILFTTR